jgi:hypothetical protein
MLVSTTSIWLSKDNHDSWEICTTSTECKTVIIVMLTVMSGLDPHMISGNLGWVFVKSRLGCVKVGFIRLWVSHGEAPDAIEASSLRSQVRYLFARLVKAQVLPLLFASETKV